LFIRREDFMLRPLEWSECSRLLGRGGELPIPLDTPEETRGSGDDRRRGGDREREENGKGDEIIRL
jgi:hypothetical protein